MAGVPPPIDHRCMEYCYVTEVSHIAECLGILLYVRLMGVTVSHGSMVN